MENAEIEKLAGDIIAGLGGLKEEAKKVKSLKDGLAILPVIIHKVEEMAANVKMAGEDKKALVVAIINKLVDVPWMPEKLEGMVISFAIDAIVTALNRLLGNTWLAAVVK